MRTITRAAVSALLALFALLLAGCATPIQTVSSRPPSERAPAADEGVFTLSVTLNTGAVGQFDTLVLKRTQDSAAPKSGAQYEYTVSEITGKVARDTALFVGSLKEGDYSIVRLYDSDALTTFTPSPTNNLLGTFKVAPGKLTDLGRIVITSVNFQVAVGRSRLITSNQELVTRFAPSTKNFYSEALANGWNTSRTDSDVVESFALTHPVGVSSIVELGDGRVAAATRLGTILLRESDGRWKPLRSGTLDAWLGLAPVSSPDAILVAVGEYGNIAKVDASGNFHPVDRGNLPMGTLTFIAGDPALGWVVAHQLNSKTSLYRTDSLEKPDWSPVLSDTLKFSFWSGAQQLWLWPTKKGFGYARSTGEIRFYDLASKSWTDRTSPEKSAIVSLHSSPGEVLGILTSPGGGAAGMLATAWISKDGGESWQQTGTPYKVKVYPPKMTASGLMLQSGGVFGKDSLQGSKDLGVTWSLLSDKVLVSDMIHPMPTAGLFSLASGFGGSRAFEMIAHSPDDGVTWKTEYSSFDAALFKAQEKLEAEKKAEAGKGK